MRMGVLHEPPPPPPPPPPPGPPPPRPPRPPGPPWPPPPPARFGRGSAAFRPSRSLSSLSEPVFSVSQSPNHFAKAPFNSARVREPSLSVSATPKNAGAVVWLRRRPPPGCPPWPPCPPCPPAPPPPAPSARGTAS